MHWEREFDSLFDKFNTTVIFDKFNNTVIFDKFNNTIIFDKFNNTVIIPNNSWLYNKTINILNNSQNF